MKQPFILRNTIQPYAWGSRTALAKLLGKPVPAENPEAELWMGAHPKAPSRVVINGHETSFLELIERRPIDILGPSVAARFANRLPFLFKVLAADEPLSIQAHPGREQARAGFARENALNIPLDAPHRNYKDDNHKPEIICALTDFWALSGFRPVDEILRLLDAVVSPPLAAMTEQLARAPNEGGLRKCLQMLMTMDRLQISSAVSRVVQFAAQRAADDPIFQWLPRLNEHYPNDVGVICAMFMNLAQLKPGQALFLPAGKLHAYLQGVGIELMANSDNVLRGGLTPKHIDINELLDALQFGSDYPDILEPSPISVAESVYETPAEEFVLSVIKLDEHCTHHVEQNDRPVRLMICVEGAAELSLPGNNAVRMAPGVSVCIPAAGVSFRIRGNAILYKASVP